MTIFLCGFMGCGKTTAGRITARKLGLRYADTDEIIVKEQGMTIPEIFEKKGERFFRDTEAETVKRLCGKKLVVSCGGGAMLNSETARYALAHGIVVFLDVPFDTCYNRIKNDRNRPIAAASTRDELLERFEQRHLIYLNNSTVRVMGLGNPNENAQAVIDAVKGVRNADL